MNPPQKTTDVDVYLAKEYIFSFDEGYNMTLQALY